MQRFLLGFPEVGLVRMPLVIGVSATPKRFLDLLGHTDHMLQRVVIPADTVRISGLLKDRILIHHPERATVAAMSLLEEVARKWGRLNTIWGDFCKTEQEARVWPIPVLKIENGNKKLVTKTDLLAVMDVIKKAIERRLNAGEIAHAMHDAGDMDIGGRLLRRVGASRINDNREIGVVVFKTSLSTGWDCPRAEVMMSFRRAEGHTYIAQLLGRMVRTPLARRIERHAEVSWLLPDSIDFRRTVTAVTYDKHLIVEEDGTFRSDLGPWERDVLGEELACPDIVGWLRNVDRKPWSMEIPYRTGRDIRPMFPDLIIIRRGKKGTLIVDILEPHDPSLADNFEKAVGLAEFAERHGHLFGRVQLIRKLPSPAGVDRLARLDVNVRAVQQKVKLITFNPQLDDLFVREAM